MFIHRLNRLTFYTFTLKSGAILPHYVDKISKYLKKKKNIVFVIHVKIRDKIVTGTVKK